MNNLEEEFTEAMLYRFTDEIPRAIHYRPTRLIEMIHQHGALETVKRLKDQYPDHNSQGYRELFLCERLDLSLEALMLDEKYRTLVDDDLQKWACEGLPDCSWPLSKKRSTRQTTKTLRDKGVDSRKIGKRNAKKIVTRKV
ncbi:hypothetical protein ANRL4_04952 [Anaerolineae bacterium]|nr:hypothetical protein ANRL4_04952 [Anaerolineae bacterium]